MEKPYTKNRSRFDEAALSHGVFLHPDFLVNHRNRGQVRPVPPYLLSPLPAKNPFQHGKPPFDENGARLDGGGREKGDGTAFPPQEMDDENTYMLKAKYENITKILLKKY